MTLRAFEVYTVVPVTSGALLLAQGSDNGDSGGQGEDFGKSSPVGLLVLLLFFIAVAFLVRSMTKHLKRVPRGFDDEPDGGAGPDAEEGTGAEPGEEPRSGAETPVSPDGQRAEDRDQ